jgi:hypothetical protein
VSPLQQLTRELLTTRELMLREANPIKRRELAGEVEYIEGAIEFQRSIDAIGAREVAHG